MTNKTTCIHCGKDDNQVPLVFFSYKGKELRICTEHLPVLIHNPRDLAGKMPDVENLTPVETD